MSILSFDVREEYLGDNVLSQFTFSFKILALTDLLIRVTDANYNLIFQGFGTDITYLSSVTFDATNGGGYVNFLVVQPLGYHITLMYANDAPTQTSSFRNKSDFTLRSFEAALDAIEMQLQRVSYLAQRGLHMGDDLSIATPFNTQIPIISTNPAVQNNVGKTVLIGPDNASLALGPYVLGWNTVLVNYASLSGIASNTAQILLANLPPTAVLTGLVIKSTVPFVGTGITSVTGMIGIAGNYSKFIPAYDLMAAVNDGNFYYVAPNYLGSFASSVGLYLQMVAGGGGLLNALSAGGLTVYYKYDLV